jgi:hypothetical protein
MQMFNSYRIEIQEININVSFLENRKKAAGVHSWRTEIQEINVNISLPEN